MCKLKTKLKLKELCKERGMKQADLARMVGLHPVSLSQAVHRGTLSLMQAQEIADILGVEVPDLFERSIKCPYCGHKFVVDIKTEKPMSNFEKHTSKKVKKDKEE